MAGLVVAFSGCTVTTTVSVSEPAPGRGTVAVSVKLDRSALAEVGGLEPLRSQLSAGDLRAAGWTVTDPAATPDGGAVVSARHPFTDQADAGRLVADIAGPNALKVTLRRHRTFWHTDYLLTGGVDLTCGLKCFGDSGLQAATGSPVGVDPGALSSSTGEQPASVFLFGLEVQLPGQVQATNAPAREGGTLRWTPVLGRTLTLTARTSALNEGAVIGVAAGGGGALLVLVALAVLLLVRRRRRRRAARVPETVTPTP